MDLKVVARDTCWICGHYVRFQCETNTTLLREAVCENCGASIRNSDVMHIVIKSLIDRDIPLPEAKDEISRFKILNTCSSGAIHMALEQSYNYCCSEYFDGIPNGTKVKANTYCVDLRNIPFPDESFDAVISEDVFEHVNGYDKALLDIKRVLKPSGFLVLSVPVHEGHKTISRVGNKNRIFHGDPIRDKGALVYTDFGNDLPAIIERAGFKAKTYKCHCFYEEYEITDVDSSIDEYFKNIHTLHRYFKYNSIVFSAQKREKRAGQKVKFTGERLVLGEVDKELEIEHLDRYRFASQFVEGKTVLDAACGTGYGSAMLSQKAKSVVGIDIDDETIQFASSQYGNENINFCTASVTNIPANKHEFDIVVSFETIEHIDGESQGLFLREVLRTLKPDGLFVVSTPNHEIYAKRGNNEFHKHELSFFEFKNLLELRFGYVKFFTQKWEICNVVVPESTDPVNAANGLPAQQAEYLIAICSNAELPESCSQIFIREDDELSRLKSWAIDNDRRNTANNQRIEQLLETKRELEQTVGKKEHDYAELQANNAIAYKEMEREKDERAAQLEQTIRNKEGHIELLLESDRELERIKRSRSWRFMTLLWMIRDFLVPKGSKRRLFGKLLVKFVKHPLQFLGKCTPTRIGKFFTFLRREGTESVSRRLDDCLIGTDIQPTPIELTPVEDPLPGTEKTAADYAPLSVPQWEEPAVSIVIPVYNQFDYTYLCVRSILEHSGDVSYEIIITDDCSTDLTKEIDRIITGLHTLHNSKNLRFLLNCNNAAKSARGKYILFLNNDTQVQENWLAPLVELIERADDIGMVGSKLVYPDGRLQEAGGILWKDGSAWNYGNRSDPDLPEYNYVKEADYISGAAIMIRRELWEEIGGFDERFVPAYCEDSDLAFEVRRHGYKVMYQPASVVVHFEGVSNGTDTSSGQKAYQVVNQKKFYEKWKDVLESEHFENGENVFQARDHSYNKETVLVIDHYIPTYDKDAGSRTVDQYIRLLVDLGFNVKLLGDNFYHNVPYAIRYEQWGVEILYGVYYRDNWKKWVLENRDTLSCVFMNRPHISVKYIDFFKSETDAKIIYYGHDLHYLRERREYELNHDKRLLKSSENWKKQELGIMQKADVVFTISCDEKEIINHELGAEKAVISPIFYYNSIPKRKKNLQDCRDIIFVGGFSHHPNEDGILWFVKKVWPTVSKRLPDSKLIVIGSNPTEQIKQIASDRIVVTGYVTDEKLSEYYESSRVCVVPLRYGAGVKGKTVEAMSFQIPIVSTAIGIEGLAGIEQYIQSSDTPNDFAERVVSLYTDTQLAESESKKYCDYLQERFSYESAKTLFKEVFNRKDIGK